MNARTLCLSILQFSDATGYEIKKMSTVDRFSYFVDVSFGSIYPALARLQDDGCVTVREEREAGKPTRKVYSITATGRAELVEALSQPPSPDLFKSEFLLVALCAGLLERETVSRAIDKRIGELQAGLDIFAKVATDSRWCPMGLDWITDYGRAVHIASLVYLMENRHRLETLAQDAGPKADAAE